MQNYKQGTGGGGKQKSFAADPLKGFLMARSVALSYAKDLCVAGKIVLGQIPDYTDRMTVLQYGQISVSKMVDAEVVRIAGRIKRRIQEADRVKAKEKVDPAATQELVDLCPACMYGPDGTGECPDPEQGMQKCPEYDSLAEHDGKRKRDDDLEELAANERLREQEDQERQAAEEEAGANSHRAPGEIPAETTVPETTNATTYSCSYAGCGRVYKTVGGLQKHEEKQHG